jgi:hypothetical protein
LASKAATEVGLDCVHHRALSATIVRRSLDGGLVRRDYEIETPSRAFPGEFIANPGGSAGHNRQRPIRPRHGQFLSVL